MRTDMGIRVVVDENIIRAQDAFQGLGEVQLLHGRKITRDSLMDADALIVRSITKVNRALLQGTPVRFVGTATIGTDHIDFEYLQEQGIAFADAAGAGSRSVAEYVVSGLLALREQSILTINGQKLGLIGVGAIGSKIAEFSRCLGMDVLEYDPPRASAEPNFSSVAIEHIGGCDVVVLSVPLTRDGEYPTHHLVNADFLSQMKPSSVLINVARGGVVDSTALINQLKINRLKAPVLDVWEAEPKVPVELLSRCSIATPHIAGYSQDGKLRGTEMMAEALANHLSVPNKWKVAHVLPEEAGRLDLTTLPPLDAAYKLVSSAYNIIHDDKRLRSCFGASDEDRRACFDSLRKNYGDRREFPAWHFATERDDVATMLTGLGFQQEADQ